MPRVAGVVRRNEGSFTFAGSQGPVGSGLEPVMVRAEQVEVIEHGDMGLGPVDAMVGLQMHPRQYSLQPHRWGRATRGRCAGRHWGSGRGGRRRPRICLWSRRRQRKRRQLRPVGGLPTPESVRSRPAHRFRPPERGLEATCHSPPVAAASPGRQGGSACAISLCLFLVRLWTRVGKGGARCRRRQVGMIGPTPRRRVRLDRSGPVLLRRRASDRRSGPQRR